MYLFTHSYNHTNISKANLFSFIFYSYVTEDGFEIDNVFERNLGAGLQRPTRKLLASDGIDSDERGPSIFWIMSPMNSWIDNVAAGSVHSGFWFETNFAVRHPSSQIDGANGFVPSFQPVKKFKNNVVHSNSNFGIQYYNPGWKPKGPESVIEGSIVYRNRNGHFVHGNGNFVIKGGICADHDTNVMAFENYGYRIDGLTIYGHTQNYLDVLDYSRTWFNCKRDPDRIVRGVEIHPFNSFGTLNAQGHFENLIFRGFDEGCPNAIPIKMSGTKVHNKVDFSSRSFVNTNFVGLGAETIRANGCSGIGIESIAIHDKDGRIGGQPGTRGFIVGNETKITTFANGDGCSEDPGLDCLQWCPNACLRMIIVQVSNTVAMDNITMIISDGEKEEEANFVHYDPPR